MKWIVSVLILLSCALYISNTYELGCHLSFCNYEMNKESSVRIYKLFFIYNETYIEMK